MHSRSDRLVPKEVFGRKFTVLVTHNENLFDAQTKTIEREVTKRQAKLREFQLALQKWHRGSVRGGQRPSVASAKKKLAAILCGQHMKSLFTADVSERSDGGLPALRFRFDRSAYDKSGHGARDCSEQMSRATEACCKEARLVTTPVCRASVLYGPDDRGF